jgi:hypothetical protein
MAGSFTDTTEVDLLKLITGQATTQYTTTPPTNVYAGLLTAAPSDAGGGTEATGGSYARVQTVAKWGTPAAGAVANNVAVTFPTASASWGTVTHFALYTASTAGTMVAWGDLGTSKAVGNGDTPSFGIGTLTITLD